MSRPGLVKECGCPTRIAACGNFYVTERWMGSCLRCGHSRGCHAAEQGARSAAERVSIDAGALELIRCAIERELFGGALLDPGHLWEGSDFYAPWIALPKCRGCGSPQYRFGFFEETCDACEDAWLRATDRRAPRVFSIPGGHPRRGIASRKGD